MRNVVFADSLTLPKNGIRIADRDWDRFLLLYGNNVNMVPPKSPY